MDYQLALTILTSALVTVLVARWWWPDGLDEKGASLSDLATIPLVAGVVSARLATVLLDHPAGIISLREVTILRGGADFWIGVAAGVAAIGLTVRHTYGIVPRLAVLAPFGLIAYGLYHMGCVIQDGCPGPQSPIGLVERGIDQRVFPVGLLEGLVAIAIGLWFMRRPPARSPLVVTATVLLSLVLVRSAASLAAPSVVGFPSRDQVFSLVAAAVGAALFLFVRVDARRWPSGHRDTRRSDGEATTT
jgi:prolipoprotein diacylglyceryltransferase